MMSCRCVAFLAKMTGINGLPGFTRESHCPFSVRRKYLLLNYLLSIDIACSDMAQRQRME